MDNFHFYDGTSKGVYNYNNLPVYALKGVHELIFKIINKNSNKEKAILVLGSGSGSFEARLIDNGFNNITSADINKNNYFLKNKFVKFVNVDLNLNFSKKFKDKFDIIINIENIEHLFSPYNFLKESSNLLNNKGILIISTPNPHSISSRLFYLIQGTPKFFNGIPKKFEHISPIYNGILKYYSNILNLKIKKQFSLLHYIPFKNPIIKFFYITTYYFFFILICLFDVLRNKKDMINLRKDIAIYIIKKNEL